MSWSKDADSPSVESDDVTNCVMLIMHICLLKEKLFFLETYKSWPLEGKLTAAQQTYKILLFSLVIKISCHIGCSG